MKLAILRSWAVA